MVKNIVFYQDDKISLGAWISAFVYSLLLFSSISFKIFDFGGKYLFEVAIIVSFVYYLMIKDSIGKAFEMAIRKKSSEIFLIFLVIAPVFFIGWIRTGDFFNAYTDYRSNFIYVVGFFVVRYLLKNASYKIIALAIATSSISVLFWWYQYKTGQLSTKYSAPLFSAVMATLLSVETKNWKFVAFSIFSLFFLAAVSFFRQYWIIAFLTILLTILKMVEVNIRVVKNLALLGISIIAIVYFGQDFVWRLFNSSESLYIQSIGKTEDAISLLQGGSGSGSDRLRLAYIYYMGENSANLIIPHGLGYKSNPENFDVWFSKYGSNSSTIDSFFLFVIYHYGYLVFLPLMYWLLSEMKKVGRSEGFIFVGIAFTIFLIPGFFDGGQVTVIPRAFWFGAFSAYLVTPRKAFLNRIST